MDKVEQGITEPVGELKQPREQEDEGKPKLTLDISTRVAALMNNTFLGFGLLANTVTKDELLLVKAELHNKRDMALGVGPLFNPSAWESKVMFFDQGIKKIDAIIMLFEAEEMFQEMERKKISEAKGADVMAKLLGM